MRRWMAVLCLVCVAVAAEDMEPRWKAVADDVYLQEFGSKIITNSPVTSVAVFDGEAYAVVGGALGKIGGDALAPVAGAPNEITALHSFDGALWALSKAGVHRFDGSAWTQAADLPMVDLCMHLGEVHGASRDDIFRFDGDTFVNIKPESGWLSDDTTVVMADGTQVLTDPIHIGTITGITSYSGTIYLLRGNSIALIDGAILERTPVDWGMLPSRDLRDIHTAGSRLYLATARGLAVLRGMALTSIQGEQGLPYEVTTCLADGFNGDLWIGTSTGAIRKTGDDYHYFGSGNWLPGDGVNAIAVSSDTAYIATNAGVGVIRYEPYTLHKKEAYYTRLIEEWGYKRLGFVHKLWYDGSDGTWTREVSDNDGGHTAHYLAALCYKYAVTGDGAVRNEARDVFEAMLWLEAITPKEGFFARSIWSVEGDKGQLARHGSGGLPAKWYETADGDWIWKGDTSSDEVNAHFYSVSLYHDLVANDTEKDRAADHLGRIAKHIIDEGWVLRDMDGTPTRWGRWDPDYLLRPYGFEARGLNGMEAQTYMWTALKLTGHPRYQAGLDQLIEWRYHRYTVREKLTFPPDGVVPWDDELAFRCFVPLLTYADDTYLRSIYLRGLERHWEVMRMQKAPFFNYTYGALTGNDCESAEAAQFLREYPIDTISYRYKNSHRHDLGIEPGYVPYAGGTRGMSPRETDTGWGAGSTLNYDGGSGGRGNTPPVGWLEAYWMGRYHGFIKKPTVNDRDVLTVPSEPRGRFGAAPYDGPPRPDGVMEGAYAGKIKE